MITKKLKGYVTSAYISMTLPPEYKSEKHRKSANARHSKRINTYAKTLPPTESEEDKIVWQIPPEQYQIKEVERYDKPMLVSVVKFLDKETRHKQQPKEKIYRLKPEEYVTEDLEKYDKAYLIRIIRWYEKKEDKVLSDAFKWDAERIKILDERDKLEKEIAKLNQRLNKGEAV